jgi:DNA-directed RNA polymerase specialized sigma24 family protein
MARIGELAGLARDLTESRRSRDLASHQGRRCSWVTYLRHRPAGADRSHTAAAHHGDSICNIGGRPVTNLNPPDWSADLYRELLAIASDPRIMGLARRRVGDIDLAEDVIQEALYSLSRMSDPERIDDLRAYFCKVVIHEAARLRSAQGALPLDDPDTATGARRVDGRAPRTLEDAVITRLMAQTWLAQFRQRKQELRAGVPGRSAHPDRYRDYIVAAAEAFLRAVALDGPSDKDAREKLLAEYPEWFAEPGCAQNARDQRFSRAHADLCALLRQVVAREDLLP